MILLHLPKIKRMKKIISAFIAIFFFTLTPFCSVQAQTEKDSLIFKKIMNQLSGNKNTTTSQQVVEAAKMLIGTPYVAGTLEQIPERPVINLHQTDCILFAETCLALAITAASEDISFANFASIIQALRYRNGIVDGYTSRLHYTSEWILQGEKNKFVKEISKEIANTPREQQFFFMSTHPQSYKQLSGNKEEIEKMRQIEQKLGKNQYFYIPKGEIAACTGKIKPGDIIGFVTSVAGLDMTHVGIAYKNNGKLTFIHASMSGKAVMIEPGSLQEYTNKIKSNIGLRIIRPL